MKCALILLFLFFAGLLSGHEDPRGDVHPRVTVADGRFVIRFTNNVSNREFQTVYSADGKVVNPRHPVAVEPRIPAYQPEEYPLVKSRLPDGRVRQMAIPNYDVQMFANRLTTPKYIAASLSEFTGNEEKFALIVDISWRRGFHKPWSYRIGVPETIYHFPTASNLTFANGKFWICWVRGGEMVLTSIKPGDEKAVSRVMDVPGNWNSSLSLAAIGDRLCLAYHFPENHEYPGTGRIITEFWKAD